MIPMDNYDVNFGCAPVDFPCIGSEMVAELGGNAVIGMGDFAADRIAEAFDQNITTAQWNIAFEQWGMWAGILIPLVAAVMLVQVGLGAITQNKQRIMTAVLGGLFCVPFAAITVLLMTKIITAVDEGSQAVVTASIQNGGLGTMFVRMLGLQADGNGVQDTSMVGEMLQQVEAQKAVAQIFPALIVMILVVIAAVFLTFAMTFREHGLLILAALAPLALMFIGQSRLVAWAEKWAGLVAGLIMMKPIVVGIMSVTVALGGEQLGTGQTWAELAVSVLVMFLCAFAPFWAVKLADLTGGEFGNAMASRPRATHKISSMANSRVAHSIGRAISRVITRRRGRA